MSGSTANGHFVWHELMTTDMVAARAFYVAVLGWDAEALHHLDKPYTRFGLADQPVAGLMELPDSAIAQGARPGWIGHVAVSDVDVTVAMAQDHGGTVHLPPRDIPGIGRFAILADPQDAVIAVFTPAFPLQPPPQMGTPGRIGWNELLTTDWRAGFGFYDALFSWRKAEAVELEQMGTYQTFGLGGAAFGGMFDKPSAVPQPFWLYYLSVADIDAAAGRVTAAGGQVTLGPMQVPGGGWILQGADPQGAVFALVGPRA